MRITRKFFFTVFCLTIAISQPLSAAMAAATVADHVFSIRDGLQQPTDTAVSDNGDIYILNGVSGQVIVFSEDGKRRFSFGRAGKNRAELNLPMAIAIKHQLVYVADTGNGRISVFDLQGKFDRVIPLLTENQKDTPAEPVSLLIMENRIIWSDRRNHQLCASAINDGSTLDCWGGKGDTDGKFNYPYQLVADAQNYIFAVDVLNARVQAFSPKGRHFMNTGHFGVNTLGSLFRPNGLALSEDDLLLVSDAYLGNITIYKNGKALGLLTDKKNKNLVFVSPTSLTIHNNRLYVTDTLNDSIDVFVINKMAQDIKNKTSAQQARPGSSRKNCISCHISWSDNYTMANRPETQVTPVADFHMCYSCHHGVVIDSRKDIAQKQQHPNIHHRRDNDQAVDRNKDEISEKFPLNSKPEASKKELYCGSCHTPHKLITDIDTEISDSLDNKHNNSWMRESNDSGEICQSCHESRIDHVQHSKRPDRGINHPVGIYLQQPDLRQDSNNNHYARDENLHNGLTEEMIDAGASLNNDQQMICQSCHKVHGAEEEKLTAIRSADAEICQQCHQRHNAKDLESARKKGVHPVNIKLEESVMIRNREIRFINCLTCHSSHQGKPGTALLVMDNKSGELCNTCHEDYDRIINTDHDLRLSAKDSNNRHHETPGETGACGACHSMHEAEEDKRLLDATVKQDYDGSEKPLPGDLTCLNCHRKDGIADKTQVEFFSHPTQDLILRSDKNRMPLLNDRNEISEFGQIGCITCHNPHRWSAYKHQEEQATITDRQEKDDHGDILSSFLRNKDIAASFCKNCHGIETKIKYKYFHLEQSR